MTRFERLSLWLSVALGLAGCVLGAASWYQSYQALGVAKATARPYVEAVGLTFDHPPHEGSQVNYRLELKNFGQASASDLSFAYMRSDGTHDPISHIAPIILQLAPGYSDSLDVFGERYEPGQKIHFSGTLEYTDPVTQQRVSAFVCFNENGSADDFNKPAGTFKKCGIALDKSEQ
jgi:hypothetical protein